MSKKPYWIKERNNPQFDFPYYMPCGQLSVCEAKAKENSIYGDNYMLRFETEKEYNEKIAELRNNGFKVT